MDTWDFFYLLTNRNQRKPFSAPNCSNKWKKKKTWWKIIITKEKKTSGGDDVKEDQMEGRSKEGRDHGSSEVAWFCLRLRKAVCQGNKLGTEKGLKPHGTEGKKRKYPCFFPPTHQKRQNINVSLTVEECL